MTLGRLSEEKEKIISEERQFVVIGAKLNSLNGLVCMQGHCKMFYNEDIKQSEERTPLGSANVDEEGCRENAIHTHTSRLAGIKCLVFL